MYVHENQVIADINAKYYTCLFCKRTVWKIVHVDTTILYYLN